MTLFVPLFESLLFVDCVGPGTGELKIDVVDTCEINSMVVVVIVVIVVIIDVVVDEEVDDEFNKEVDDEFDGNCL